VLLLLRLEGAVRHKGVESADVVRMRDAIGPTNVLFLLLFGAATVPLRACLMEASLLDASAALPVATDCDLLLPLLLLLLPPLLLLLLLASLLAGPALLLLLLLSLANTSGLLFGPANATAAGGFPSSCGASG
jgi:hypothetical protein